MQRKISKLKNPSLQNSRLKWTQEQKLIWWKSTNVELTDLKGVVYHTLQEYLTRTIKLSQGRILLEKPVTCGQWGPGLANGFAFNSRHKFVKLGLLPLVSVWNYHYYIIIWKVNASNKHDWVSIGIDFCQENHILYLLSQWFFSFSYMIAIL